MDWEKKSALMDVDNLASRFHQVYQKELKRQGKKSKYSDFFFKLPEDIADLDRALARYVIEFVTPNNIKSFRQDLLKELRGEVRELIIKASGYEGDSYYFKDDDSKRDAFNYALEKIIKLLERFDN